MESSSLIFTGSRSRWNTFVTTLFVVALAVGTVGVTGFVLFAVFGGWNTGVNPGRHSRADPLVGEGGNVAAASPRSKGPYTPRWYSALTSDVNSTSAVGDDVVTFIDTPVNDTSLPPDGAESDAVQPVVPAVDEPRSPSRDPTYPSQGSRPDSAEIGLTLPAEPRQDEEEVPGVPPTGKSKEVAGISETAAGDAPSPTEGQDAEKSRQDDLISKLNAEYVSREPSGSVQDDDDSRPRSQVPSNGTVEEDDSDEPGEDEFEGEADAVEADFRDATSDSSSRTEAATETLSHGTTRVVSVQGTNYEPGETDDEVEGRDEHPSSEEARTEVTAAITHGQDDELEEEDLEYDTDATVPATDLHITPDDERLRTEDQSKPESPIADAVSERGPDYVSPDFDGGGQSRDEPAVGDSADVGMPEKDEGVEKESDHSSSDGTSVARPRVEGTSEPEPPYQNEYVTEPGIDQVPAEIESGTPDRDEPAIRDEANTGPVQVPTYEVHDVTQSVSQDAVTYGGNQRTGYYVTPMDVSIHAQGGGEAQPYKNDAISDEESSSATTALEITYGTAGDADISSIIDEEDGELAKITTQNKMLSYTPATFTTKDNLQEAEFLNTGNGSLSQTLETSEAGPRRLYETSEGSWDDVLPDSGSTVPVPDEDGIADGRGGKIAPITRDKRDDGSEAKASTTRTTAQEDDFDKIAREAYSFTEDSSETELPMSNPTTERNADGSPAESVGIGRSDGTTYLSDEMDWSEIGSVVPEKRKERQMAVPRNPARTRSTYVANGTVAQPLNLSATTPAEVTSKVRPRASRPKTRNATAPAKMPTPPRSNGHKTQRHNLAKHNGLVDTPWRPVNFQAAHRDASSEVPVGPAGSNASAPAIGRSSTQREMAPHVTISWTSAKDTGRPGNSGSEPSSPAEQSAFFTLKSSSGSPQKLTPPAKSSPVIITSQANVAATLRRHIRTAAIVHTEANRTLRGKGRSTAHNMPRRDYHNRALTLVKQQPAIAITTDPQTGNSFQYRDLNVPNSSATARRNVTKPEVIRRERFATTRNLENSGSTTSFVIRSRRGVTASSERRRFGADTSSLSLQDTTASTAHNFTVMPKRNDSAPGNILQKRGGGRSS